MGKHEVENRSFVNRQMADIVHSQNPIEAANRIDVAWGSGRIIRGPNVLRKRPDRKPSHAHNPNNIGQNIRPYDLDQILQAGFSYLSKK